MQNLLNEYLDIFNTLPDSYKRQGSLKNDFEKTMSEEYLSLRRKLCSTYSYSVPTHEALTEISKNVSEIFDFGCGSAYWSFLLKKYGVNSTCYDINIPSVTWTGVNNYFNKDNLCPNLFLSWPPQYSKMAMEALRLKKWDMIIYVGEMLRGCAEIEFFFYLWQEYELVNMVHIPQWTNRSDAVYIFSK